jgi:hypothetical protein
MITRNSKLRWGSSKGGGGWFEGVIVGYYHEGTTWRPNVRSSIPLPLSQAQDLRKKWSPLCFNHVWTGSESSPRRTYHLPGIFPSSSLTRDPRVRARVWEVQLETVTTRRDRHCYTTIVLPGENQYPHPAPSTLTMRHYATLLYISSII